jgi:ribosomal protein S18 acetylase RimI-like enzyme
MTDSSRQPFTYDTIIDPPEEILAPLQRGLEDFNHAAIDDQRYSRLAVVVRAPDQTIIGGVAGEMFWDWLHIETLWVHVDFRGRDLGTTLMRLAEDAARAQGITKVHLETISFQALDFYLKCGYQVFGTLEGKPPGNTWYYLKKVADPET